MSNRCSAFAWSALFWLLATTTVAAADPLKVSQRWALLIGVDDYAYAQKLQYCGADQTALASQLVTSGFPKDQVFLLHDKAVEPRQRPSQGNIQRHLELVLNLADADDLVIIAFSGHGVHLNGKSYLCPGDGTLDDEKTLISVDALYEKLKECAAQFKLVLVDACRNDPRPGGTRALGATEGTRALARMLQDTQVPEGVVLLNSCAPGEVSWEDEKFGHGVFMHYVLDGLQGAADTGGDGNVSLNELQAYAGARTKAYVANQHRVAQRPFFKGDLTTEALEYALLPVPAGLGSMADRYDKSKPPMAGIRFWDPAGKPVVWGVLRGSPAADAGVAADDLLLTVGGKKVVNGGQATAEILTHRPGDSIEITVRRGGREVTLRVTPVALPADRGASLIKASADAGEVWAMVSLGLDYLRDDHPVIKKDVVEGARLIRQAADTGDATAICYLGRLYADGVGVTKDEAEAVRLFERARAVQGKLSRQGAFGSAALFLGDFYAKGRGVAADPARAAQFFQEAADADEPRACFQLGLLYEGDRGLPRDYARALELHRRAAAANYPDGEFSVGLFFQNGWAVQKDLQTARTWYERAVEHGQSNAMFYLAGMYENGQGVSRDLARAAELYRSAADRGNVYAMRSLGVLYETGAGVARDYAEAMKLFRQAADGGVPMAEFNIGVLYLYGHGVAEDLDEARRRFETAWSKKVPDAANALAWMYDNGKGVTQDYARAMEYYQAASKLGFADARTHIGDLIYFGRGVQRDLAAARQWYETAAAQGHYGAMYMLGVMSENGEGGPKNLVRAAEWYRKAADLGHPEAKKKLE